MKFRKLAKSAAAVIMGASVGVSAFAFAACGDDKHTTHSWGDYVKDGANGHYRVCTVCDEHSETEQHEYSAANDVDCNKCGYVRDLNGGIQGEDPTKAKISVTVDKDEINAGTDEKVKATATIEGLTDKTVVWTLEGDGMSYVEISQDGVLSLKKTLTPQVDQTVKIVATSAVSKIVTGSVTVSIKAPVVDGNVEGLTTAMFEALGNPQITVTGEVQDVYDDLKNDKNDVTNTYDYKVMMSDGEWYGEWNRKGSNDKDISNYRRGEDGTLNQVYINKDNEVAQKPVTDYDSVATEWSSQHLWNHLAQLGKNVEVQWRRNSSTGKYIYNFDNKSEADLYLRAYLSVSLTPMLTGSDTLEQIALTVDDDVITTLEATTVINYRYEGQSASSTPVPVSMEYSKLTAVFSNVGNTAVPEPAPYETTQNADVLQAALDNMGNATNYTFKAAETTISAPSVDEGDYDITTASARNKRKRVSNYKSATGQEGVVGQVTEKAVLLAKTGKYSSSTDANIYHTEYSGYKYIDDSTYDYFEYDASENTLVGKRQYKGDLFDIMPKFDFSANIFEYKGREYKMIDGKEVGFFHFVLREPAITRDVAMQISAHRNASSAQGSTYGTLKLTVTDTGIVYSTEFPYSLVSGSYVGVVQTTYSKIGTTELDSDTFDGYKPRVVSDKWEDYAVMYYHPDHSTQSNYVDIDAGSLFNNIYGTEASIPSPTAFYNVFGDAMAGPFFDWKEIDNTATGGQIEYLDYVSLTMWVKECDENSKINKEIYDRTIGKLSDELIKYGYELSPVSTPSFGENSYAVFVNASAGIAIRINNIRTVYFYVSIVPIRMING